MSFYFKDAGEDPCVYLAEDSSTIVQEVQNEMNRLGLKGKHSNVQQTRWIADAVDLVTLIQVKEKVSERANRASETFPFVLLFWTTPEQFFFRFEISPFIILGS